jgi:hypothetical protein
MQGREDWYRKAYKKVESKLAEASEWVGNRGHRRQWGPGTLAEARRRKLVGATVVSQEYAVAELQLQLARGSIGRNAAQQATWSVDAT